MNEYKFKVDDVMAALYIRKIQMGYFNFKTFNSTEDGKFEIVLERNHEKSSEVFDEGMKNLVSEIGISHDDMVKLADPKEVQTVKEMEQQGLDYISINREKNKDA